MSLLRFEVRVDQDSLREASHGARAEIIAVTAEGRRLAGRRLERVWLKAGRKAITDVAVDAGCYLVRVELPSGELVEREVRANEGEMAEVRVSPAGEPETEMSLEYFVRRRPVSRPVGPEAPAPRTDVSLSDLDWNDRAPPGARWGRVAWALRTPAFPAEPLAAEEGPLRAEARRLKLLPSHLTRWIRVARGPDTWLLAAPGSWADIPVHLSVPNAAEVPPEVIVPDPDFVSFGGFLARGKLIEAAMIADAAWRALYAKFENPVLAAAGAYVLGATEGLQPREHAAWLGWMENLCHSFPTLPDGAIALAAWRLRQARTPADLDAIVGLADVAFKRGLPLFTFGLQTYVDVLMSLGNRVNNHRQRLGLVRFVAARSRLDHVFTTLTANRADQEPGGSP